ENLHTGRRSLAKDACYVTGVALASNTGRPCAKIDILVACGRIEASMVAQRDIILTVCEVRQRIPTHSRVLSAESLLKGPSAVGGIEATVNIISKGVQAAGGICVSAGVVVQGRNTDRGVPQTIRVAH